MKTKPRSHASKRSPHPTATADAVTGQTAFETLEAELLAIPKDQLSVVNVDVQLAGITALAVARAIDTDSSLRRRFEALAGAKEFDLAKLDGLESAALAAWYARHMYLLASATHSDAQLPVALATSAANVKTRMMRVVEYYLADHAVAGPIVLAIRAGAGYLDVANDLVALARLYVDYRDVLAHDKKDYQATDETLAAQLGKQIITLLGGGATPEQRTWSERQTRAWSKLDADYAEVLAAGRFLKRNEDDVLVAFPSLIAASRSAAVRAPAAPTPTTPPITPPTPTTPPAETGA